MNIGIVTTWFERGAAYVSRAYMESLQSQGHDLFIYVRGGEEYGVGDPVWDLPIVTWGRRYAPLGRVSRHSKLYIDMLHFERWLRKHDIQVIIFNEEKKCDIVRRASSLGYSTAAYIDYYKKSTVEDFRVYDCLLCNTKRHYSVFQEFPGCHYIPWGTDIELFSPQEKEPIHNSERPVVFFHSAGYGGINTRKGTDLLLEAFQLVSGNASLIIHSQVPKEKYGDRSASIITGDPRIEFIEKTVSAPGLFHLGDVFVYPTRLEGIGLCVPEALACGLPVITTDCAPMNEFVEDGVNGLLVAIESERFREDAYYWPESIVDIRDLAKKMEAYCTDREMLSLHQANARKHAEASLNWQDNSSSLGSTLQRLAANKDRRRPSSLSQKIAWGLEANYVSCLTYLRLIKQFIWR